MPESRLTGQNSSGGGAWTADVREPEGRNRKSAFWAGGVKGMRNQDIRRPERKERELQKESDIRIVMREKSVNGIFPVLFSTERQE